MPDSSTTAETGRAAAQPKAGAAPTHPTSTPPSAGPLANAMVRASSIRALAAGNRSGDTSDGTKAGAATLRATRPPTAHLGQPSHRPAPGEAVGKEACGNGEQDERQRQRGLQQAGLAFADA